MDKIFYSTEELKEYLNELPKGTAVTLSIEKEDGESHDEN